MGCVALLRSLSALPMALVPLCLAFFFLCLGPREGGGVQLTFLRPAASEMRQGPLHPRCSPGGANRPAGERVYFASYASGR